MKLILNLKNKILGKWNAPEQSREVVFTYTHFIIGDNIYYLTLKDREELLNHLASTFTENKVKYDSEGCYYERS